MPVNGPERMDASYNLTDIAARPLSRLTYKIMSLNLLAILILVIGIGYLDRYREGLTNAEMETLSLEARLYAAILAQSSLVGDSINISHATSITDSFASQKNQEIHVFSPEGKLLLESGSAPNIAVTAALPATSPWGAITSLADRSFASLVDLFAVRFNLPMYPKLDPDNFRTYPDVEDAMDGALSLSAWRKEKGDLVLSSATPIKKDEKIIGILLVTRPDTGIQATFAEMRIDIMNLFLLSLTITITFSLYLSAAIGHPLRKLASAAEAIKSGQARHIEIPDMSNRDDEVGELSTALRQMTESLNDRLDSIERFAADVSHELKNPLTSMRSAVETLQKVKSDADRKKLNDIIMHDLVRMDRLISDISQASRIDAELSRDVFENIDLRDVLLPLIDAQRNPLERGDKADTAGNINFSGLGSPVMVLGHKIRLIQVFQNLIDNALSFSPPGHQVQIKVEPQDDYIRIVIEDDGPGIPEGKLEKIFERFYSERPTTEAFGNHSGLGLSIVKQILAAHNGKVQAENRLDEKGERIGARFIVRVRSAKNREV